MSKRMVNPYPSPLSIPDSRDLAECIIPSCTLHTEPGRRVCPRHDQRLHRPPPRKAPTDERPQRT